MRTDEDYQDGILSAIEILNSENGCKMLVQRYDRDPLEGAFIYCVISASDRADRLSDITTHPAWARYYEAVVGHKNRDKVKKVLGL